MKLVSERRDFLLEIGTEELPASYIAPALEALRAFGEEYAPPAAVRVLGTPRRLTLAIQKLCLDRVETVYGPPLERSRNPDGSWNQAALGFARAKGVSPAELGSAPHKGGEYLMARVRSDLRRELVVRIPELLARLSFPKSMRWLTGNPIRFARPIRRLVCLLGKDVVELEAAGVKADRVTTGLRFFGKKTVSLPGADLAAYLRILRANHVLADPQERRRKLTAGLLRSLRRRSPAADVSDLEETLLEEVLNLVEYPRVIEGGFDADFLALPPEVPATVMKKHQRYFPIRSGRGKLLNRFLLVANGPYRKTAGIRANNERVLRARLADARFFWDDDISRPLPERRNDLGGLVFHNRLGSYLEKTQRLERLARFLAGRLGLSPAGAADLERAAGLCKADLTTAMVVEFTELQGAMGYRYALAAGEGDAVAEAIRDHYLPRAVDDVLPAGELASALGLADRADTVAGFFHAGIRPSGSQDPYGLRRQVLGLIRLLAEKGIPVSFSELLSRALQELLIDSGPADKVLAEIRSFALTRLEVYLENLGYPGDLVRAVLASGWDDLAGTLRRLRALASLGRGKILLAAATIVERTANIARGEPDRAPLREDNLAEPAEKELFRTFRSAAEEVESLAGAGDYAGATEAYARLLSRPLGRFFRDILVNVPDPRLRENRVALLLAINRLYAGSVADLSLLQFERGEHLL